MYSKKDFQRILDNLFVKYPGTRFNMAFVCSHILKELPHVKPEDYHRLHDEVRDYLREEAGKGSFTILKGMNGGIFKNSNFTPTVKAWEKAADVAINATITPTNDHVCPCCRNDRVSKSEKTCWKCGGSLH